MTIGQPKRVRQAPTVTQLIARRKRQAQHLLRQLGDADAMEISLNDASELADWRKTVDFAKRHGMVPVGHRLEKRMLHDRLLRIELVQGIHPNAKHVEAALPVPTPKRLIALHPVVASIRDADDRLQVPAEMRRRALTALQALAAEVERRGNEVVPDSRRQADYYYGRMAERRQGRLSVVIQGVTCWVSVGQNAPETTNSERAGQLCIEISPPPRHAQYRWVDGKRKRVEERLAEVLSALDAGAADAVSYRQEVERKRLHRQSNWELAMARAKELAILDRHLRVLRERVNTWKFAEDLRDYTQAVGRIVDGRSDDDAQRAEAWLAWASNYLRTYDPLRKFPTLPETDTEPTIKELEPHLEGMSPYGPDGY